jgi:hypothetical protein
MKEPVVIVWATLAIAIAFIYRWAMKSRGRKITPRTAWHILIVLLVSSIAGLVTESKFNGSPNIVWVGRLIILVLGIGHLISLYYIGWSKRDSYKYKEDSILPEGIFTLLLGLGSAICFCASPRSLPIQFFEFTFTPDPITMWDAPIIFLLPFVFLKLFDFAGHVPSKVVENPWIFPLEEVNTEHWPWRDLIRINFRVSKSLRDEGHIFGRWTTPWIEVPREISLGKVFQLNMQEHRKHRRDTIQDLGNEYVGEPFFWWIFSIKWVWWKPSSWWRSIRYLDPDATLSVNLVRNGDIIRAKRVSKEALEGNDYKARRDQSMIDPNKTIIFHR